MEANKLMIGDLVKTSNNSNWSEDLRGLICRITNLGNCYISSTSIDNPDRKPYGSSTSFEPIPLTAEILEKNFEKKTLYGIFDDYFDFEIREFNDSMYIVNYHSCEMPIPDTQISNICFVHELQHALRLCNIEKTIEL